MIEVRNLTKAFGAKLAVNDLSFSVQRGEVLGFLGPNGAGKSTTMRMLTGFIPPTEGDVEIGGFKIEENPIAVKCLLGYLPENAPAYADMTVHGFLSFAAELRGFRGAEKERAVDRVVEMCFLGSVLQQSIETLSKGFRHRTCFAQSIIHDPAVLILDEPTDGLDPNQKHEVRTLIQQMGEKKAIIFSTHILEEVEAVCSRAIIIDSGRIVANGTPAELKQRSPHSGAVTVRIVNGEASFVRMKLGELSGGERLTMLGESPPAVRIYPRNNSGRGELAAAIGHLAAREDWQIEELHTEEGRLDEVFRAITLPETAPPKKLMVETIQAEPVVSTRAEPGKRSSLGNIMTIAKREISGYFASPVAYVFIVIFLLLVGFFTFMVGGFFERGQASLEGFFAWHPWLYLFLVPAVGMRMWSEERRLGTIELLLTMPVTPWQAIVGKFLASWLVLILALALTFPLVITVNYLGHPDNGIIAAGYVGSALLAGAYLAIAAMTSAMTRNQVVSFILSVVLCLFLTMAGWPPVTDLLVRWANPWFVQTISAFSVMTHFDAIQKGVLDSRDILYFVSVIAFCLFTTSVILRAHRAG